MNSVNFFNSKRWHDENGALHREDGPAVEYSNGGKEWYQNGQLHREDGPAREWSDGTKEWWYKGEPLPSYIQTVEQLKSYIRNKVLW